MSRPQSPIVCDGPGCGKTKQEANHWWQGATPKQPGLPFEFRLLDPARNTNSMRASWNLYDFCGQTCAIKFISEQMGKARGEASDAK